MKNIIYTVLAIVIFNACKQAEVKTTERNAEPVVSPDGIQIKFPDEKMMSFFKGETVKQSNIEAELAAPGKVIATVLPSGEGASQNIILFDNPELSSNYTQLIQHQISINQIQKINIKQKQIQLDRIKDLQAHGAATGQELLNAQTELSMEGTNLANERAALIEHETKLKAAGFNPEILRAAKAGTAYLVCEVPESEISRLKTGHACNIEFTAFPNEKMTGKIDAVADLVDNNTRMIKVRISINNATGKLKSGMFANVYFGLNEGVYVSTEKNALITVQGNNYVFVKKADNSFERRPIQTGPQIGDRIVIFSGLSDGETVATEGVMQLKGLSFGY